jgi:hypothetical protein
MQPQGNNRAGVVVQGEGIAGCCCAHLLRAARFPVTIRSADRATVPVVMLSEGTQSLLADVFGRSDLFHGLPRIEKRIVAWGRGSEPLALPHSSVIISEHDLAERLRPDGSSSDRSGAADTEWAILASRPLHPSTVEHHFGSRTASVFAVDLREQADPSACWIESLESGWLFLIRGSAAAGWLLAVGGAHQALLRESRMVAEQIQTVGRRAGQFPAYPRIADPLGGHGWLVCGSAALAFDPLCGDGTGNAVREAILAAAVVRAVAAGAEEHHVLAHYRARLLDGFRRHLEICRQFYTAGQAGAWWDAELDYLTHGLAWCDRERQDAPPYRYRLSGFELRPIA